MSQEWSCYGVTVSRHIDFNPTVIRYLRITGHPLEKGGNHQISAVGNSCLHEPPAPFYPQ